MTIDEQRNLGISLAEKAGAPETTQLLQAGTVCYKDIFKAAIAEVGLQKLVDNLQVGDPIWAYEALRNIDDLGTYKDALIKKASEDPVAATHTLRFAKDLTADHIAVLAAVGANVASVDISEFWLYGQNAIYIVSYIMQWSYNGTAYQSSIGLFNGFYKGQLPDLANSQPLYSGQIVSMSVQAQAGNKADLAQQFRFINGSNQVASLSAAGTVDKATITYDGASTMH